MNPISSLSLSLWRSLFFSPLRRPARGIEMAKIFPVFPWPTEYKVHLAKLALMAQAVLHDVAAKVKNYLFSIFENFPMACFRSTKTELRFWTCRPRQRLTAMRSSKSRFETLPLSQSEKQNLANNLAALGLLLARKSRDRHPSVQDFMLANASCTIAREVPVYPTAEKIGYYKSERSFVTLPESSKPITGHIDVVQARNGFIHLLDYKAKPVGCLCAGLRLRTRLSVKVLKCGWLTRKAILSSTRYRRSKPRALRRRPDIG
jgi:hypothetical protein